MTDHLYFIIAVLILLGAPGPTNTLLWASGAATGVGRSMSLLAAVVCGYLCAVTVILVVLQPAIDVFPAIKQFLAIAAAIYIAILAVKLWRQANLPDGQGTAISPAKVFTVTLLNPKAFVVTISLLPPGKEQMVISIPLLVLSIFITGISWISFGYLTGNASGAKRTYILKRISSGALAVFAGVLLVSALGSE